MAYNQNAKRVKCPECGKPIAESYLPGHRRTRHNVFGGRSGKPRGNAIVKANGVVAVSPRPIQSVTSIPARQHSEWRELPWRVLEKDGILWVAQPASGMMSSA